MIILGEGVRADGPYTCKKLPQTPTPNPIS
jgi:hypothetical protein